MRVVSFFIPHYEDHDRLSFMISLLDKLSSFPYQVVIYDSSPEPIGLDRLSSININGKLIYREFSYNINGHTYPYVLRDFCLSNDSNDGAFILPNDEMIILNYNEFALVDPSSPFSCGSQFSFCPQSQKVAEYSRAIRSGHYVAKSEPQTFFSPQYHGTFMPGAMLKSLGKFMDIFIKKWGDINTTYIDFIIINILEQLNTYYSKDSIYLQEKLQTRKSNGMFNHPYKFIGEMESENLKMFRSDLLLLWNSIPNLSPRHFKDSLNYLLNSARLRNALYMPHLNKADYLFKLISTDNPRFSIERTDIFNGYHILGSSLSSKELSFLFGQSTKLSSGDTLESLREILKSYA